MSDKAKTAAIPRARKSRKRRMAQVLELLEKEVWPSIPRKLLGRPLTKSEREKILG